MCHFGTTFQLPLGTLQFFLICVTYSSSLVGPASLKPLVQITYFSNSPIQFGRKHKRGIIEQTASLTSPRGRKFIYKLTSCLSGFLHLCENKVADQLRGIIN